jgi:hypothetical protein
MQSPSIRSRTLPHRWAAIISLILLAMLTGCRATAPRSGTASFEIVTENSNVSGTPAGDAARQNTLFEVVPVAAFVRAPQAQPEYPPEALAGNAGSHVLFLTTTFDSTGRLVNLQRNPTRVILPNPFAEAFFAAGKAAIEQWKVDPAREVYGRIRPGGGEKEYQRTEVVGTTIEIKFIFHESGAVR